MTATALDPGCVAVWYRRTDSLTGHDLHRIESILSDEERARRNKFVFESDRRDFAAAHALLREVLSTYATIPPHQWLFERGSHGKPEVSKQQAGLPRLAINLSHTRGLVACAIARGVQVGVDVERTTRLASARDIAEACFSAPEKALVQAATEDCVAGLVCELWTLKESYLKATGVGLTGSLRSFCFQFVGPAGLQFIAQGVDPSRWHFELVEVGRDARLAVAIQNGAGAGASSVSFHDYDANAANTAVSLRRSSTSNATLR